ncbi:hypothetical protein BC826DRAFT_1106104 [Russula brevipes]|nr:hypothetical protein BC826DRAFT_1106104 [Russula brevipes]
MENPSVTIPATSSQWPADEFIIRPLTSADIQNVRALHVRRALAVLPLPTPNVLPPAPHAPNAPLPNRTLPSSNKPVACIATAFHVPTSDLTTARARTPVEVHVLALGVLPPSAAAASPRASSAPPRPPCAPTRVCADVVRSDGSARAFWDHVGIREEVPSRREPWSVGWRDVISVAGPVLSAA